MTTPSGADTFYVPLGAHTFASTEHTAGPWDPGLQHAGPPSALLTRAIEREPAPWPATITRVTVDLLGPVPVAELDLHVEVLRSGRSVELVQAQVAHGGRVAARATAWRVRRSALALPALPADHDLAPGDEVPPMPSTETPLPQGWGGGYLHAMEWRQASGAWGPPGAAAVWGRMRYPLVPDEEPTGWQRLMAIADSGNGISHVLPFESWFFINPDLTVHLAAAPAGEWICLDARTRVDPAGFGLATSRLFDRERLVARGAQALYIGPR